MPDATACIHISGLRVQRDGAEILRGLSLTVGCGERLIIAGPNGAGKTRGPLPRGGKRGLGHLRGRRP